jgi:hypothetical protein
MTVINIGGGVNSTAILALIKLGKLSYENPRAMFADTGAEKPETYAYVEYLQSVSPIKIEVIRSKEGGLWDYCKRQDHEILPMRGLRWCSDRFKRKPLNDARGDDIVVIGIDAGEAHRAKRWQGDDSVKFPLIELGMNRQDCIKVIQKVGWNVPVKSGCFICPYAKPAEFAQLKTEHRELFDEVCEIERKTLARLKKSRMQGWYGNAPLDKLVAMKNPETVEGQVCLFCVDW